MSLTEEFVSLEMYLCLISSAMDVVGNFYASCAKVYVLHVSCFFQAGGAVAGCIYASCVSRIFMHLCNILCNTKSQIRRETVWRSIPGTTTWSRLPLAVRPTEVRRCRAILKLLQ
jgi:hypothetical protein